MLKTHRDFLSENSICHGFQRPTPDELNEYMTFMAEMNEIAKMEKEFWESIND